MALIIPLPSVTATTLTSISLLGTAASGGTAPYTYQWYRTLSAAGVYSVVAGATSLTLADTGLSAEQEYSYSLRATDAVAATGYSVQVIGFTAQAAFDTNGADAGLTGIVAGGAGSSTETYNTTPPTLTNGQTSPFQADASGNLKVNVVAGGTSGGTSSTFNQNLPTVGTAIGFIDQNGKMQAASVASFHSGDNTSVASGGLGLLTGGVTQIKNAAGNLDRQTEAGLDNTSALGVTTGAAQFAVPFTVTITSSIVGSTTPQTLPVASMAHIFVGTVINHDTAASNEAVVVTAITATTLTAVFKLNHGVNSAGQAFYYNQGRDAAVGDKVPTIGLSPSVTYLINTVTGLAEQDRSAAGELDGATGTGTAIAAEYEFNGNGPLLSTGFSSGFAFDRARSLQAKGVGSATQNAGGAINTNSITVSLASAVNSLQPGQQIRLDRGTGTEETAYVSQSYGSGSASISLQSNLAFNHTSALIEWDVFASAGPGLNGFTATGIGIEEEALYNPVDGKYYIERASTTDAMPSANIVAESGVVWNGTTFDRERAAYQDALPTTGIPAEAEMLWNGSTFDRARSIPATDAQASTGFGADAIMLWNGTTYDRVKGTNGSLNITVQPQAIGTLVTYRNISLNAVGYIIKAAPGSLFGYYITNLSASVRFIKLYNKASAPVVGTDIPMATMAISAGVTVNMRDAAGISFTNGIAIAATNLVADTDTTSPAANDIVANVYYV